MAEGMNCRELYLAYHHIKTAVYGLALFDSLPEALRKSLPQEYRANLAFGLEIHDISKTIENGWTEEILFGSRHPTAQEWHDIIRPHPLQAAVIAAKAGIKDQTIIDIMIHHHVRYDGKAFDYCDIEGRVNPGHGGYPVGVLGSEVSIAANIANIADSVCAMEEDRPYRRAHFSAEIAVDVVRSESGKQFNPVLVDVFCEMGAAELARLWCYKPSSEEIKKNVDSRTQIIKCCSN